MERCAVYEKVKDSYMATSDYSVFYMKFVRTFMHKKLEFVCSIFTTSSYYDIVCTLKNINNFTCNKFNKTGLLLFSHDLSKND